MHEAHGHQYVFLFVHLHGPKWIGHLKHLVFHTNRWSSSFSTFTEKKTMLQEVTQWHFRPFPNKNMECVLAHQFSINVYIQDLLILTTNQLVQILYVLFALVPLLFVAHNSIAHHTLSLHWSHPLFLWACLYVLHCVWWIYNIKTLTQLISFWISLATCPPFV